MPTARQPILASPVWNPSARTPARRCHMRVIPTRLHGVLDYVVGLALIFAPMLLGFANGGPAQFVPQMLGVAAIGLALVTDYELGLLRLLPMQVHLALDFASGLLLLTSPWLFGFADVVAWPHVLFGLLEIGVVLLSGMTPSASA
eukprot:gene12107-14805_t